MYIGKQPQIGNYQTCDSISATATDTFNLTVGSVAVSPISAHHCLVSLNGILQAPISSYTISGSTIVFASALTTSDSIDFITILGSTLDTGTPSDGTVTSAKIASGDFIFNESGADADLRVESDGNTSMLHVDAGNNRVGIGTGSPANILHVSGTDSTPLAIQRNSNGSVGIGMAFNGGDSASATAGHTYGSIFSQITDATNGAEDGTLSLRTSTSGTVSEKVLIDSAGAFFIGKTSDAIGTAGKFFSATGANHFVRSAANVIDVNRLADDGELMRFFQAGTQEGGISISGSTTAYNTFTGTHWSRLADNSKPTILRGTVLESLDAMVDWYNLEFDVTTTKQDENGNDVTETHKEKIPHVLADGQSNGDTVTYNHKGTDYQATIVKETDIKHTQSKISTTSEAKNVYGVFFDWDNDGEGYNDFYVASVGSYVVRIKADETIAKGDLLQSNGDGTAKVQSDDNVKSSSFAKILSTTKIETYEDGSFTVPCSLNC